MKIVVAILASGICCFATIAEAEPKLADAGAYGIAAPVSQVTLPNGSMVVLEATTPVNSGALHVGSKINLSVVYDVKAGNTVVIPAGTPAEAEISWRTGRSLVGKSGKIEFDVTRLHMRDRDVNLTGHYRVEGNGAPWASVATIAAVGWPGLFVTGHNAKINSGTQFIAYTRENIATVVPLSATAPTMTHEHAIPRGNIQAYEGRRAGNDDAILISM